ncbi:MAG: hypothetical protein GWN18_01470, partial [Thermoplasmata archaeon]|nr:hypothetical protein [Thermoplasmata archaeon]NIS18625.1 hypothetical protein [Thermoplasmata archaeon]NIV77428.1 hypothetical protein [Thermoplasmata archaeon]NIW81258.1 hypothetical protein [Thermoplasmata archaeon]
MDSEDIDGDGFEEMVFGVYRTAFDSYRTKSPLYMGSAIGPGVEPAHEFPTQAVTGVLLRDLNEDGHCDMVFAQERDMTSYHV